MITWFLAAYGIWSLIGVIVGLLGMVGALLQWGGVKILWWLARDNVFDHLCNQGPQKPQPPPPSNWIPPGEMNIPNLSIPTAGHNLAPMQPSAPSSISGRTKIPGWAAAGVVIGILLLVGVPVLMLVVRGW